MDNEEWITITKQHYDRLVASSDWLECLEAAGVDNWQGYDEAVRIYNEEISDNDR